jgi:hypothetical protein
MPILGTIPFADRGRHCVRRFTTWQELMVGVACTAPQTSPRCARATLTATPKTTLRPSDQAVRPAAIAVLQQDVRILDTRLSGGYSAASLR